MLLSALLLSSAAAGLVAAQTGDVESFVPVYTSCPQNLTIRPASGGLSQSEQSWRNQRSNNVMNAVKAYLQVANITGLDVQDFTSRLNASNAPVAGLSVSGGGTLSGLGGLGIWQAFDARYPSAIAAGTGGLTQILSYITGLSGGGAVTVSAIASNNFSTIDSIRQAVNFSVNYEVGPDGNSTAYFDQIFEFAGAKAEAGFPVTIADVFGQFWATYLPPGGIYSNYSDLAEQQNAFSSGNAPMPIITLAEVIPGQSPTIGGLMYPGDNDTNAFSLTSYEVTPFEFGSWAGGRVQAFMPTKYLGSQMSNGVAQSTNSCVQGFDKFTLIQGSTTDAYTAYFIDDWYNVPVFAKRELEVRQNANDIYVPPSEYDDPLVILVNETAMNFGGTFNQSLWATYPNPFKNYNQAMTNVDDLLLVDGSLSGETNPIRPLIVPARGLDLIIVYEASTEAEYSWDNGTTLGNTAHAAAEGNIPFPSIPDVNTMIALNMTKQPTFFGCSASSNTPLVLYLPNSPWSGYTNYSYTTPSFTNNQVDIALENAFNLATYGNGTVDAQWPQCIACATIRGSARKIGFTLPDACTQCFQRHCWNGSTWTRPITEADLDLQLRLNSSLSYAEWNATIWNQQDSSNSGSSGNNGPSTYTSGAGRVVKGAVRRATYPVVLGLLYVWHAVL